METQKNSNVLIKTIIFVIVAALSCLLFFGLGEEDKTSIQYIAFGFFMFSEVVIFISAILAGSIGSQKLTGADIISAGVLYLIANVLINFVVVNSITTNRTLIVYNCAAILAYMLIVAIVVFTKRK